MVDYCPQKEDPNRTILKVGVSISEYPVNVITPTADTITSKIVRNILVSTTKAKCICIDIKTFYLVTPLTRYKYLHIAITLIPEKIIQQYSLLPLVRNGFIYLDIRKGMYGFPQAWRLENDLLTELRMP